MVSPSFELLLCLEPSKNAEHGEATAGSIMADPPIGGTYYLVYDNTFSAIQKR